MRIGYADQNGRDYVAIGRLLRDRGILPPGGANMEAISAWMRANPDEGKALMRENLSLYLLQGIDRPGPAGRLNVPVTPRGAVAADPKFVPLGAPVFLDDGPAGGRGLWVAQDTGGAIKGANRFDTFWGAGAEAMRSPAACPRMGEALILLPKGSGARAQARPEEAELWAKVAATIRPLSREPLKCERSQQPLRRTSAKPTGPNRSASATTRPVQARPTGPAATLDGSWDRRLRSGRRARPGRSIFMAITSTRLEAIDRGLERAIAAGDRVLLLITGHHRPGEPPVERGRIRAAVHDWLAASRHAGALPR